MAQIKCLATISTQKESIALQRCLKTSREVTKKQRYIDSMTSNAFEQFGLKMKSITVANKILHDYYEKQTGSGKYVPELVTDIVLTNTS